MPVDSYLVLVPSSSTGVLAGQSGNKAIVSPDGTTSGVTNPFTSAQVDPGQLLTVSSWNFAVETPTTIGSATGGAGTGKAKLGEFTVERGVDSVSPALYQASVTGKWFSNADLIERRSGGSSSSGQSYLGWRFGTVFVTRISWAEDDDGPKESVTFVYASLAVQYKQLLSSGEPGKTAVGYGWDQSKNVVWDPQKIVA